MVVALSEEQAKAYLESGKDLGVGFDNFTKNLCEKYGFTPLQVSLHLDEGYIENGVARSNIHAHLTLFNFDFDKERSVLRTLKKQDYKDLQDLAANSFQEVGFNFIRGIDKEITKQEHLEKNDHVIQKQTLELKQQILEINELKNKEKELLKTLEKGTIEHDDLYAKIGILQAEEKDLRAKVKELSLNTPQDFTKLNNDLANDLVNKYIEKNMLGNKVINNISDLKKDIFKELNNAQNLKLVIKENEDLKKENETLKNKDNNLKEQNDILLEKLNKEREKNNNFEQEKNEFLKQSNKLIKAMEKQQSTIKRQVRRNTRLRNQRRLLLQKVMRDNNLKSVMQTRNFLRNSKNRVLNKKQVPEEQHDFKSL